MSQAGRHRRHARRPGRGDRRRRRALRAGPLLGRLARIDIDLDLWTRQTNDNPVYYVQYAPRPDCRDAAQRRRPRASTAAGDDFDPALLAHEREGDLLRRARRVPAGGRRRRRAARAAPGRALPRGHRGGLPPVLRHRVPGAAAGRRGAGDRSTRRGCCWSRRPGSCSPTASACSASPRRSGCDRARTRGRLGPRRRRRSRARRGCARPPTSTRWCPRCGPRPRARTTTASLEVGGVDADRRWSREHGTPAYVLDEADFRARARAFRDAFAGYDVYYAGKAFLCTTVARWVAEEGLCLDVCSGGELAVALRPASTRPGSASTATTSRSPSCARAVERRGRAGSSSTPSTRSSGWPRSPRELGRDRPRAGAGDRRRRGAHPRVHRHRPRGPEVRLLARRRRRAARPCGGSRRRPGSSCSACTPTSARRSSTPPASRSPRAGWSRCTRRSSERARRHAARARPRRRLRHRLHDPGRPVRPRAAGHRADQDRRARVPRARHRPCRACRSSRAGRSSGRRCARSTRSAPSSRSSSTAAPCAPTSRVDGGMSDNIRTALYDADYSVHARLARAPTRRRCSPRGRQALRGRRHRGQGRVPARRRRARRPARRARHRRLLPLDGQQLQPRAAPAGGRGARRRVARSSCAARPRTTCCAPTLTIRRDARERDDTGARMNGRCGSRCSAAASSGRQVVRLLREQADDLAARVGAPVELVGVAVRRLDAPRDVDVPDASCSPPTPTALVARDDVDLVVEVIGGIEPARSLILAALEHGASVVTANKALLAEDGADAVRGRREGRRATSTTRPPSPARSRSCGRCASRSPATGSPGCSASSTAPPTSSSTRWTPRAPASPRRSRRPRQLGLRRGRPDRRRRGLRRRRQGRDPGQPRLPHPGDRRRRPPRGHHRGHRGRRRVGARDGLRGQAARDLRAARRARRPGASRRACTRR